MTDLQKIIDLGYINNMAIDDILSLYRQGCTLGESNTVREIRERYEDIASLPDTVETSRRQIRYGFMQTPTPTPTQESSTDALLVIALAMVGLVVFMPKSWGD